MAELAEHNVESTVNEGKVLSVTLVPLDARIGNGRILLGALEQLRGEVESRDVRPAALRGDRHDPGTAADVEDPPARLDASERDQPRCRRTRRQLEWNEGCPRLPLCGLELCQRVHVYPPVCSGG